MASPQAKEQLAFESAVRALEAEIANIGTHLILDSSARLAYANQIRAMSNELRGMAASGRISWAQAAQQAVDTRNAIMEVIRARSTPAGLAMAQKMKQEGKTLNEIVARQTQKLYGDNLAFNNLSAQQKNQVYLETVKAAGKSNPKVTAAMKNLSHAGRGLLFLSIALSVYSVATADDKLDAAGKELAVTGAGIGGGIAGGALAGLACGPGAPICVTVGAFIGGALAAFGVDMAW